MGAADFGNRRRPWVAVAHVSAFPVLLGPVSPPARCRAFRNHLCVGYIHNGGGRRRVGGEDRNAETANKKGGLEGAAPPFFDPRGAASPTMARRAWMLILNSPRPRRTVEYGYWNGGIRLPARRAFDFDQCVWGGTRYRQPHRTAPIYANLQVPRNLIGPPKIARRYFPTRWRYLCRKATYPEITWKMIAIRYATPSLPPRFGEAIANSRQK